MKKVMLPNNGHKLSKLYASIRKSHLLEGIERSTRISSAGMPMPRLIRKGPIISFVSRVKPKPMSGLANRPKVKDKLAPKWKKKVSLLTPETIRSLSLSCTSTLRCGKRGETKRPSSSND